MKKRIHRRLQWISLFTLVFIFFAGCSQEKQGVSVHDLIDIAEQEEALIVENNKIQLEALYNRQYGNKLYLEEVSTVEKSLIPA